MANQTVSTDLNLDSASILGLNNGDTLTINSGATLTFNSDNRWSQQAAVPQSISVDAGTGGTVYVDGTTVWEIPFSSSTGVVPTITTLGSNPVNGGTSLATGEFLSVFASGSRVPTAAGAAMPATGYIKLRYTSGTFQAETITLQNGATIVSSGPGKRSWINFVTRNNNQSITVRRLGNGLIVQGDWYEAGTTQGISGETLQMPVSDVFGGLFIEKSPGSASTIKDYTTLDRWTLVPSAAWNAFNISNDALNGQFFTCNSSGLITFGNGTIGKIPMANCKVYIGNVIMSSAASADYATNVVQNQANLRATIAATMAKVFIDKATLCGWYLSYSAYIRSEITNSTGIDRLCGISNSSGDSIIKHSIGGSYNIDSCPIFFSNCINGNITIEDITSAKLVGTSYRNNSFYLESCRNISIKRINPQARRPWLAYYCSDMTVDDIIISNNNEFQGCSNVKINNTKIYGRPIGIVKTNTTSGSSTTSTMTYNISGGHDFQVGELLYAKGFTPVGYNSIGYNLTNGFTITATTATSVTVSSTNNPGPLTVNGYVYSAYSYPFTVNNGSTDIIIDGISLHPDKNSPFSQGLLSAGPNVSNIRIRNAGTRTSPIDLQSISNYITNITTTSSLKASRIFVKNTTSATPFNITASDDIYMSEVGQYENSTLANDYINSNNIQKRRIGAGGLKTFGSAIGQIYNNASVIGNHFTELEVSETETILGFVGGEKTTSCPSKDAYEILAGNPQFDGLQGLIMQSGDIIEYTSPLITSISGFNNVTPYNSAVNLSNHTIEYDLDKGTGFSGTYKVVSGANLSSETGINSAGFKIKFKITCTVSSATNRIQFYGISMATTNVLKDANPYPFNYPKLTLTGAISGSDICVYDLMDNVNLTCEEQDADYTYYPWHEDFNAIVRCRKPGYKFVEFEQVLTEYSATTPIEQIPWVNITGVYPGDLDIGITNHGTSPVSWEGKDWSITVQVSGAYTANQVANYLNYRTSHDWSAIDGIRGDSWPEIVIENECVQLETARGRLLGSLGATEKGTRVIDISGNAFVGFARMQSDDGTYYVPPQYVDGIISGIVPGSRLRVFNSTQNTEITNEVISGTSWSIKYLNGTSFTTGDLINIYLTKQSGTTAYLPFRATAVATDGGWSTLADQTLDIVYNTNAIDGSAVTEFVPDYPHIQIDISDGDGITSVPRLYAFYCYILTSEDGIRYWFDAIEAVDTVNYKVNVDILDLKLDNTIVAPILVVGGRLYRSDGTTVIAASSGSIQMDPDRVYVIETPKSGLTSDESTMLTKIHKLSKLIPACIK